MVQFRLISLNQESQSCFLLTLSGHYLLLTEADLFGKVNQAKNHQKEHPERAADFYTRIGDRRKSSEFDCQLRKCKKLMGIYIREFRGACGSRPRGIVGWFLVEGAMS